MPSDLEQHYFQALDEIWRLRRALAYEAGVVEAHLDLKTFPSSRRGIAARQVLRMQMAARGQAAGAYAGESARAMDASLVQAGASETLTRGQWEQEAVERG